MRKCAKAEKSKRVYKKFVQKIAKQLEVEKIVQSYILKLKKWGNVIKVCKNYLQFEKCEFFLIAKADIMF